MSSFDFAGFSDGGNFPVFVAHARKYTTEDTVRLCKIEYEHLFEINDRHRQEWEQRFQEPTIDDVQKKACAFRFGVSDEWPNGCYTLVSDGEGGSFPVYVIDFDRLKLPIAAQEGVKQDG